MQPSSTTASGVATLQGHGLVVADGTLGRAVVRLLLDQAPALTLTLTGRTPDPRPETRLLLQQAPDRLVYSVLDLCRDEQLADLGTYLDRLARPLRLVFNASGWLHGPAPRQTPEKRLAALHRSALHESFAVNAWGPALLAQVVEPVLKCSGQAWFGSLSARVGSIGDNRLGVWYSYRAAKAAQNQLLRTVALEWRPHPAGGVRGLPPSRHRGQSPLPTLSSAGSPRQAVHAGLQRRRPVGVLLGLTPRDSGGFWAWDGQLVPW